MGDQNSRRVTKGVEDLDFFIGDEAFDASGYAVKVSILISETHHCEFKTSSVYLSVSRSTWNCRGLGLDGALLGAVHF